MEHDWIGTLTQVLMDQSSWLIAGAIGGIVLFVGLFFLRAAIGRPQYRRRETLLTEAELRFLRTLDAAVGGDWRVFSHVRIADVLTPRRGISRSAWWRAFTRISSKHLDFLLVDPDTTRIRVAIELDDSSHARADRVERDRFLDKAFARAGLPLLRFAVHRQGYRADEIRAAILKALRDAGS